MASETNLKNSPNENPASETGSPGKDLNDPNMKKCRWILLFAAIVISSCKTYYMTPRSLAEQLSRVDPDKIHDAYDFRLGLLGVALKGGKNFYNGIDTLEVTDKKGKTVELPVTTNSAVRLTDKHGRRLTVYFDSMFMRDSMVYGSKSHFLKLPATPMRIDSVAKVEVSKNS